MSEQSNETGEDRLIDPIASQPGYEETETRIALEGHPIHAMSVAFPIALTFCLPVSYTHLTLPTIYSV